MESLEKPIWSWGISSTEQHSDISDKYHGGLIQIKKSNKLKNHQKCSFELHLYPEIFLQSFLFWLCPAVNNDTTAPYVTSVWQLKSVEEFFLKVPTERAYHKKILK